MKTDNTKTRILEAQQRMQREEMRKRSESSNRQPPADLGPCPLTSPIAVCVSSSDSSSSSSD